MASWAEGCVRYSSFMLLTQNRSRGVRDRGASRHRRSGRAGFTIIELMIGLVLVGLVLSAAFGTVGHAVQTMEKARDYARVTQILQSKMEDFRTMSYSGLESLQDSSEYTDSHGVTQNWWVYINLDQEFLDSFGNRYRAWYKVSDRGSDQKLVRFWVSWQRRDGTWQAKRTASLFTKDGLHDYYYRSF